MPTFYVKGTIKSGLTRLQGVSIRAVVVGSGGVEIDLPNGAATTDANGEYLIGPVDLQTPEPGKPPPSYKILVAHPGYSPSFAMLPARSKGQSHNSLPLISIVHESLRKTQDPFERFNAAIFRGPLASPRPAVSDAFFYSDVEIRDLAESKDLMTAAFIRAQLLGVAAKDTWKKDFDENSHQLVNLSGTLYWKCAVSPVREDDTPVVYDIKQNNLVEWDWITWETEGNADPKYQRGARERKLGLYKLNYDKLRKAGDARWKPAHTDGTLGGGRVKIGILDQLDYNRHRELIDTFLPSFTIINGKPAEPVEFPQAAHSAAVGLVPMGGTASNTLDIAPPQIVMPFNYDDNSPNSRAIGKILGGEPLSSFDAKRLSAELTRWATASRSTITAFPPVKIELTPHPEAEWKLRPAIEDKNNLPQVTGPKGGANLRQFQVSQSSGQLKYYSVKTGVDFVSTVSQKGNNKDLLESNSIHAMSRSNIIAGTIKRLGAGRFKYRYQIEILCILILSGNWDGIQIREIGKASEGEIWFPALAIPSHGRAFAEIWSPGCNWADFWERNFAYPLGHAKAEMLCYFGLQHMTSNAQNFLVAFDRAPNSNGGRAKDLILRDIGDTLLNVHFFHTLREIDNIFETAWEHEKADAENGCILGGEIGGGYFNPRITRTGATIVFAFKPFLKGDLDTEVDPSRARILARWGVAHNHGFIRFMEENIAYYEGWSKDPVAIPASLPRLLRKHSALDSANAGPYPKLAEDLVGMSSASRWQLFRMIEAELLAINPATKQDVARVFELINAHEMLITADVQSYISGPAGIMALKALHNRGPVRAPRLAPLIPVVGPACPNCGGNTASTAAWHRCPSCRLRYCPACVTTLEVPKGDPRSRGDYKYCGCGGITEPIRA